MRDNESIPIGVPVQRADLPITGDAIGRGGQATVYPTGLRYVGYRLVFKEYNAQTLPAISPAALTRLVQSAARMSDADRTETLERVAWPLAEVVDAGRTVGFLMPQVESRFRLASHRKGRRPVLAEFQFLLNSPGYLSTMSISISRQDQIRLLLSVAESIGDLHRRNIIVGDLSPKNLLFYNGDDGHASYLLDCDSMVMNGVSVSPQVETPGWAMLDGEPSGTLASDAYKFGLLVLRLLAGDQDTRDPNRLPPGATSLHPLVARALTGPASRRPAPDEWIPVLSAAARRASSTPLDGGATARAASATTTVGSAAAQASPSSSRTALTSASSAQPVPFYQRGGFVAAVVAAIAVVSLGALALSKDEAKETASTYTPPPITDVADPYTPGISTPVSSPPPSSSSEPEEEKIAQASGPPVGSTKCSGLSTSKRYYPASRPNIAAMYLKVAVGDTVPATHCNFAERVVEAWDETPSSADYVDVVSPNTGKTYRMSCNRLSVDPYVVRCSDGNTAEVYLYY